MYYYTLVVDNRSRMTDIGYTYSSESKLEIGTVVLVEFGKSTKLKMAVVVAESKIEEIENSDIKIKKIDSVFDAFSLTEDAVNLALWMTSRYAIRKIDALKLFFPQGRRPKKKITQDMLNSTASESMNIGKLTDEQDLAVKTIMSSIESKENKTFLLHGVTGSGKTEVYFRAIEKSLSRGETAVYLVPEITHIDQILRRLVARFGSEVISVIHSRLNPSQRFLQWEKVYKGESKIILGTRSALFTPIKNVGVIIMDEEHENAYKSDKTPNYETVDIAYKMSQINKSVLILGSATPSVVSYYRAESGIYTLLKLTQRYNKAPLPKMDLIDMRDEIRGGNAGLISSRLYSEINKTIESQRQVILFANRRDITQAIELACEKLFPEYSAARLDMDIATKSKLASSIMVEYELGLHDILIGTQIIAKSIDYKNVGLVGIIAADSSIRSGDYRGGERTYQLITQVAGRAGRGDFHANVLVQTMDSDSFYINAAINNRYDVFYQREIKLRKMMDYPPFSDIVEIAVSGRNLKLCREKIDEYLKYIAGINELQGLQFLSPRDDVMFQGDEKARVIATCKCPPKLRSKLVRTCNLFSIKLAKDRDGTSIMLDVNPY